MNALKTPIKLSYAQNREDIIIKGFFPDIKNGFYVDIGANDPVIDSVTKNFYDQGWNGINIEPIDRLYKKLQHDRVRDINVKVGISNTKGELEFVEYEGHGLSTFSSEMKAAYENKDSVKIAKRYVVNVLPLKQVLKEFNVQHIHFMKIDVEGYEFEVIEGNDWTKYRPELICIESNHLNKDWRPLLEQHKYIKVFFDGINDYFLREESSYREKYFSYPDTMLWPVIITPPLFLDIQKYEQNTNDLSLQLAKIKEINTALELENENLRNHLKDSQRIRNLIKGIVFAVDKTIVIHLKKISRQRYYYPNINISEDDRDPKLIIHRIQVADREAFNGSPNILILILTGVGSIILSSYLIMRKYIFKFARFLYRKVLRRKHL